MLLAPCNSDEIGGKADRITGNHARGHVLAKVFDDGRQAVEATEVETRADDEGGVEGGEGVAFVGEGLVAQRGNGETFLGETGHDERKHELEDHQATVAKQCTGRGEGVLQW